MERQLDIDEKEHALALMRSLDNMRKERKGCDLIIKVGNDEMAVHRSVVRSQSDYFDAMLSHETLESESGVVEMKGVRFEPVKKCVDFIYSGKISTSNEKCEELLYTASLMQIKPVCNKIAPFLEDSLDVKSFFDIRKIAARFDLCDLSKVCLDFGVSNLNLLVKENEFHQLEMEYVLKLLASVKVGNSKVEDSKLATILHWIKGDAENRSQHLISMVGTLDLARISPQTIKYMAENEPLFCQSVDSMKLLVLAGTDRSDLRSRHPSIAFPSSPEPNNMVIFDQGAKCLRIYNPLSQLWTKACAINDDMCKTTYYNTVAVDTHIYVLFEDQRVYCLNLEDQESGWTEKKRMLRKHCTRLQGVTLHDYIYVLGKNLAERYCLAGDVWQELDTVGISCDQSAVVEFQSEIYSVGGLNKGPTNTANKLCHSSLEWFSLPPMQYSRHSPAATVFMDKIYVAGGFNVKSLTEVECFNPLTSTWTVLTQKLTKPRCAFLLCVIGDKMYAAGHENSTCTIEEYDPALGTWKVIVDQPEMKIMGRATCAIALSE